ncbi:MAG TPA: hypothetical protein VK623_13085 [Flavobacterium sp.]|nr:hypothetical protein [Flavobacterium sp.]
MGEKVHYGTVTEAINKLRAQGFTIDFNLEENYISSHSGKYEPDDFEIVDVYRYEGNSDPGDEAAVYAIESKSGEKGILVTGYGISSDTISTKILRKLSMKKD